MLKSKPVSKYIYIFPNVFLHLTCIFPNVFLKKAIRFNTDLPSKVQVNTSIKVNGGLKNVDFQLISLPLYLVREFNRFI